MWLTISDNVPTFFAQYCPLEYVNSLWHIITSSRVNGGSGHFMWSRKECIYALDCDNLTTGSFGAVIGDLVFALSKGTSFYICF